MKLVDFFFCPADDGDRVSPPPPQLPLLCGQLRPRCNDTLIDHGHTATNPTMIITDGSSVMTTHLVLAACIVRWCSQSKQQDDRRPHLPCLCWWRTTEHQDTNMIGGALRDTHLVHSYSLLLSLLMFLLMWKFGLHCTNSFQQRTCGFPFSMIGDMWCSFLLFEWEHVDKSLMCSEIHYTQFWVAVSKFSTRTQLYLKGLFKYIYLYSPSGPSIFGSLSSWFLGNRIYILYHSRCMCTWSHTCQWLWDRAPTILYSFHGHVLRCLANVQVTSRDV